MKNISKLSFYLSVTILLAACSSLKVPDLNFIKTPEIRKDAENIGSYPRPEEQPQKPTDLRSDVQWDLAARAVEQKGESLQVPVQLTPLNGNDVEKKIQQLSDRVDEYKKDDPQ